MPASLERRNVGDGSRSCGAGERVTPHAPAGDERLRGADIVEEVLHLAAHDGLQRGACAFIREMCGRDSSRGTEEKPGDVAASAFTGSSSS